MPAISEYAKVASSQHGALQLPADLGQVVKWLGWFLAAYLAFRLLVVVLRGPGRR